MQAAAEFEDLLAGILCLRTFRASSWQTERLRSRFSDLYQAAMKVEIAGAMPTLLVRFSLEAGLVLILFLTLANPVHTSPEMLICLVFSLLSGGGHSSRADDSADYVELRFAKWQALAAISRTRHYLNLTNLSYRRTWL